MIFAKRVKTTCQDLGRRLRYFMSRKSRLLAIAAAAVVIVILVVFARPARDSAAPANSVPSVMTVEVATPQSEIWARTITANGSLAAWQEVIVSPETGGLRIAAILADVGATVKRGQLLARLADESLQAEHRKQEAVAARSRASLDQARSNVERAQAVKDSGALSTQQIEEYGISEATARAELASEQAELDSIDLKIRQTRIVAPDDGFISSRSAVLGNVVSAGAELYRMVRQSRIEWQPELDARQLATVRVGQKARITLPGGDQVEGEVRLVGPTLSNDTGRGIVYVSLPQHRDVKTGVFVQGIIELDAAPALTLPQSAIVSRDGRSYVYLVDEHAKVGSRPVVTGRRQADRIEVVSGIEAGARIVAAGGAFLSEGAQVTLKSAAAPSTSETRS